MAVAFLNLFDANVVQNIMAYVPLNLDFYPLYGTTTIYRTKHYVTYGGGPEGGFVYFASSRKPGWYKWHRDWFQKPTYERVEKGQVAFLINADGSEEIGVLPEGWEETVDTDDLAEMVIIADDAYMQEFGA